MQLVSRVRRLARQLGSQRAAAQAIGVSEVYVSEVLRGSRRPGPSIQRYFGVQREERYAQTKEKPS